MWRRLVELGCRDVVDDGLEERIDVLAFDALLRADPTGLGVGVEDGEVDLMFIGIEVQEQLLDLTHHFINPGVGPVHLVDDEHHGQAGLEGLAQHEAGLGQGTLGGIDQ